MDLSIIMPWIGAALSIIALATQLKTIFTSGEKKLDERVTKVETKMVDYDRRVQALESDLKHLPDRETTHRIEMTMAKIIGRLDAQDAALAGRFEAMDERLKPIQAIGERLQDVLVEQARKTA
ncbi:DUF2730 family protein [Shinella sp. BYT-45]|uniref:DUF2730 family protein n=1 Tax=Shinella sp. BYT-45 TaxID=3377377 RepID=UPI00397FF567